MLNILIQIIVLIIAFLAIIIVFLYKIAKEIREDEEFRNTLMSESHPIKSIYD